MQPCPPPAGGSTPPRRSDLGDCASDELLAAIEIRARAFWESARPGLSIPRRHRSGPVLMPEITR
jgi:hypothetical protein